MTALADVDAVSIAHLAAELDRARRDRDQAAADLRALRDQAAQFRTAVRRRVIEAVNDRHICRPGANEALRCWGMPVLRVEFDTTVEIGVELTVTAADEDAAAEAARETAHDECARLVDGEVDAAYDIDIDRLRPVEDPPRTGEPLADPDDAVVGCLSAYQVAATFQARLTVTAEDEDDAAEAAVEVICDRIHRLDRGRRVQPAVHHLRRGRRQPPRPRRGLAARNTKHPAGRAGAPSRSALPSPAFA